VLWVLTVLRAVHVVCAALAVACATLVMSRVIVLKLPKTVTLIVTRWFKFDLAPSSLCVVVCLLCVDPCTDACPFSMCTGGDANGVATCACGPGTTGNPNVVGGCVSTDVYMAVSQWGECSQKCGNSPGVTTRSLSCIRAATCTQATFVWFVTHTVLSQ
jgi:hypothetical protein